MTPLSRAEPNVAFCSYCGRPPSALSRAWSRRVCERCEFGVLLGAPAYSGPRPEDPFVIVDRTLAVQAFSRQAEIALGVEEPAEGGVSLKRFMVSDRAGSAFVELMWLVERAMAGRAADETVVLCAVRAPGCSFEARVTRCGPPNAGLVVFGALSLRALDRRTVGAARRRRELLGAGNDAA